MRRIQRLLLAAVAVVVALAFTAPTAWAAIPPSPYRSYLTGDDSHHDNRDRQKQQNAQPNPNCTLVVPPNPLSAQGLATPYELTATDRNGPCHEASPAQSAFVEATILDQATGHVSIYRPLVIDRGTQPAVQPVPPNVDGDDVVGIWFGFQGTTLTLAHAQGCVNGAFGSQFGQFAFCNAPAFFRAAHQAIQAGQLQMPVLGMAKDGQPCPTTRDFSVVDQDQSDNVITRYVVFPNGLIAQDNATNADIAGATFLNNGSDNGLLDNFILPTLGCQSFTAPDQTAGGRMSSSLALNELQAEQQPQPVALVPLNDPMTLFNGRKSFPKTNLYRLGVDQPFDYRDTSRWYCQQLVQTGAPRLRLDQQFTQGQPSPDIAMAPDLAQFLQVRFKASLTNLGCPRGNPPKNGDG